MRIVWEGDIGVPPETTRYALSYDDRLLEVWRAFTVEGRDGLFWVEDRSLKTLRAVLLNAVPDLIRRLDAYERKS